MANKRIFRYRIITNLQCNQRCSFCYQNNKPPIGTDVVLPLDKLEETLKKVGKLDRATLMGGESTLLEDLPDYIKLVKEYVDKVCLVTNGTLLTRNKLFKYKEAGLDEIAISINSMKNYEYLINNGEILLASGLFRKGFRINIPRCEESSDKKLFTLVDRILSDDFYCVVCEDLNGRFGKPHEEIIKDWNNTQLIKNDGHNFLTYRFYLDYFRSKEFGLFAHYKGYNNTDVIISPLGNFSIWDQYCKAVGNCDVH